MAAEYIDDHIDRAVRAMPSQFRGKPNMADLLGVLVRPLQRLEDMVWALLSQRSLETATGARLEQLGKLVGESRNGRDDADYLRYIQARIITNRSNGTIEDLLSVARILVNSEDAGYVLEPGYPAGISLRVEDVVVDEDLATELIRFLKRTVGVARKMVLEYWPYEVDELFACGFTTFLSSGAGSGSTALNVVSTVGWPSSGSLILDEGTALEEQVTYGSRDATNFLAVSPCAASHLVKCSVRLVETSRGLGFGVNTFFTAGSSVGATTLNVVATAAFPSSGSLILDEGTALEEVVTYSGKTSTTFTGVSPCAFAHLTKCVATLNDDTAGGKLAGAKD